MKSEFEHAVNFSANNAIFYDEIHPPLGGTGCE